MMRMKLTKSNYAGVNSREDAHTDHEKSEADNAPETSLGVTYIQLILILIMQHVEKVCPKRVYLTKYHEDVIQYYTIYAIVASPTSSHFVFKTIYTNTQIQKYTNTQIKRALN